MWNPPRGTGCPCVLLCSALGLVGSHRWRGNSTERTYFSEKQSFYRQGLTLACNCSQLPRALLPAAGTPLLQDRPGHGNRPAIGPAAQGGLVWWQYQEPQQGYRAEFRLDEPRTPRGVLRGERPKRVLVSFARSKETPSGERPRQAGKPEPWVVRRTPPFLCPWNIKNRRRDAAHLPGGLLFHSEGVGCPAQHQGQHPHRVDHGHPEHQQGKPGGGALDL